MDLPNHLNPIESRGSVLVNLDNNLIDLLRVVKLAADSLKIFITVTFMVSVSCYIVAVVTLRVIGSEMPGIQRLTFHNWTVWGLLVLAITSNDDRHTRVNTIERHTTPEGAKGRGSGKIGRSAEARLPFSMSAVCDLSQYGQT